ncbi:MAG: hypothetical protein ABIB79_05305 [archaeon]
MEDIKYLKDLEKRVHRETIGRNKSSGELFTDHTFYDRKLHPKQVEKILRIVSNCEHLKIFLETSSDETFYSVCREPRFKSRPMNHLDAERIKEQGVRIISRNPVNPIRSRVLAFTESQLPKSYQGRISEYVES